MLIKLLTTLLLTACSTVKTPVETTKSPEATTPTEFSAGELILGTELLTKIFDEEMAPLTCVSDTNEAELLLRTIRPRMEVVQDDLEAMLDDDRAINRLISNCDKNCTCGHVDELLREHQVNLSRSLKKTLEDKKSDKELTRCLNYVQSTFCESELYKTLNKEKSDFTFEGET